MTTNDFKFVSLYDLSSFTYDDIPVVINIIANKNVPKISGFLLPYCYK